MFWGQDFTYWINISDLDIGSHCTQCKKLPAALRISIVSLMPVWSFRCWKKPTTVLKLTLNTKRLLAAPVYTYFRTDIIESPVDEIPLIPRHLFLSVICCCFHYIQFTGDYHVRPVLGPLKADEVMRRLHLDKATARRYLFICVQKSHLFKATMSLPWFGVGDTKLPSEARSPSNLNLVQKNQHSASVQCAVYPSRTSWDTWFDVTLT